MTIQLETWQILTLIGAVLGFIISIIIRVTLARLESSFNERRQAANNDRKSLHDRLIVIEEKQKADERELLQFKADLPLNYVRREDYVRNQTVIESKLDSLASKLEQIYLRGTGATHA